MPGPSTHAPVALFVYARPEHTRKTLVALSKNEGADRTLLYIFADGPPAGADEQKVERIGAVRKLLREQTWCGEVRIVESETNRGLAASIISGVGQVAREHGRVIVLEDDLETSPGFLSYMNSGLETYAEDARVAQVSGWMPKGFLPRPGTGFLRVTTSWGWATWDRAWREFQPDAAKLLAVIENSGRRREFDLDGFSFHFEELKRNAEGSLKTWHVLWYASVFVHRRLCLYPSRSLVRNIGFDGTGTNCHNDTKGAHSKGNLSPGRKVAASEVRESPGFLRVMQAHYRKMLRIWTRTRFRDRVARKLRRLTTAPFGKK